MNELLHGLFAIDTLAACCNFFGMWLLSSKKRTGFLVYVVGNCLWVVAGINATPKLYGLAISSAIAIFIFIRGYIYWGKEK